MEWSFRQQILYLAESGGFGFLLGMVYDVFRACGGSTRRRMFWWDAAFGPIAALMTLFAALIIMDGRMHPLLFAGIAAGFAAENRSLGRFVPRILRWIGRGIAVVLNFVLRGVCGRCLRWLIGGVRWLFSEKIRFLFRSGRENARFWRKNARNSQKNTDFFAKNS